jgi:signal transduction histidine kinase/ActR/RegA family two-component response regulator
VNRFFLRWFSIGPSTDQFPPESGLTARFWTERRSFLNRAVSIGAVLAITLVPLFSVLDYHFKHAHFWTFFQIRIMVVFAALCVLKLAETKFGHRNPYWLGAVLTLVVGGSIALMCTLDMGPEDPYYAGINLPVLAFGILFPMTVLEGMLVAFLVWFIYFIPNLLICRPEQISIFLNNNFFMISTIVISLVASHFHLQYREREWYARIKLEKAHRKIRRHSRELEERVRERTQKLIQSERLAVVGQLAGGIAHDFNNHLTAILGMSEILLKDTGLTTVRADDLTSIRNAGLRASELVKQLLTFSRQQLLNPKVLNLNDIVRDVHKLLLRLIGEDIELVLYNAPTLHPARLDPVQAEQILLNLAINARDAMPNGGRLFIETKNVRLEKAYLGARPLSIPPGHYAMLAVSDNGLGMDDSVKTRIFEPFFTTKENGKGTGLGLSTVYGIVKQAHGDIMVYSEVGVGTTIKIFLPGVNEKVEFTPPADKTQKLPRGKETILLVEDEASIRELTARLLRMQGYTVVPACEGLEALEKVDGLKEGIHLLMTDVVMPNMNGRELAEKLFKIHAKMKVLYFSGYTDAFIQKKGILTPECAFLQKPFTFADLSLKVRAAIDN